MSLIFSSAVNKCINVYYKDSNLLQRFHCPNALMLLYVMLVGFVLDLCFAIFIQCLLFSWCLGYWVIDTVLMHETIFVFVRLFII